MDVYPSLTYRDVEAALAFLEAAFGLEPVVLDEDGQPLELRDLALGERGRLTPRSSIAGAGTGRATSRAVTTFSHKTPAPPR